MMSRWYKQWWVWLIAAFIIGVVALAVSGPRNHDDLDFSDVLGNARDGKIERIRCLRHVA